MELDKFNLWCGDCIKLLEDIPSNSIDLIVTEPPYKTTSRGNSGTMGGYWKSDLAKSGKIFENNNISCTTYLPEFYRILKDSNGNNLHNTEKPVELMKVLIENSSNEGDVVLDPFMGIGSTGVACKNTNRNFIGIELDESYFNIAKQRIESEDTE